MRQRQSETDRQRVRERERKKKAEPNRLKKTGRETDKGRQSDIG